MNLRALWCALTRGRKPAPARVRTAVIAIGALAAVAVLAGMPAAGASSRTEVTASRSMPASAAWETVAYRPAPAIVPETVRAARTDPARYTIRSGDTLGQIAARYCGSASAYPALAAGNGIADVNLIYAGHQLALTCHAVVTTASVIRHRSTGRGGKIWGVTYGYPNYCGDGDGDGWDVACAARATVTYRSSGRHYSSASSGNVNPSSYSGFEACVIARESGGNSQVMNSSGHYGLFQFSESTWEAYGGSAGTFGHASVAEQQRVFSNAMAQGGRSNWSPYDGC